MTRKYRNEQIFSSDNDYIYDSYGSRFYRSIRLVKPSEILYASFLLATFAAAILLVVVTWIQYNQLEVKSHEKQGVNSDQSNGYIRRTNYEQSDGESMGCRPDAEGFSNYILPNIRGDEHPGLYIREAKDYPTPWAPIYYYPWHKHPRLDETEPSIQPERQLVT